MGRYSNPEDRVRDVTRLREISADRRPRRRQKRRQTQTRLPAASVSALLVAYRDGARIDELSERFGVHRNTVMKLLHKHGAESRRGKLDRNIEEAAALYLSGWSLARVGHRFDVDPATVRNTLKRHGITTRPRPGWHY